MPFDSSVVSNGIWLDGAGGSDLADGLTSTTQVATWAKALTVYTANPERVILYKNARECIQATKTGLSMLVQSPSVPASRGDTVVAGTWTNVSGSVWKSAAFTPLLANVGTVVVDWDTVTRTSWDGVPAHLYAAANVAGLTIAKVTASGGNGTAFTYNETVTQTTSGATGKFIHEFGGFVYMSKVNATAFDASNHTLTGGSSGATRTVVSAAATTGGAWFVGDDAGTNRLYISTDDSIDPNAHVVAYTEHRTSGAECNGIDITGDSNYVEGYPALWTEGAGSGNGSNGKGGWGVILRGDNDNRIVLFGGRDNGYKHAAVVGNICVIEGVNGGVLAGLSNTTTQGVDNTNGNAAITIQGGSTADTTSLLVKNLNFHMHGLLWRTDSRPISPSWAGGGAAILCHGQGHLLDGVQVLDCNFYNDFDVTSVDYLYVGNLATPPASAKLAGTGHPFLARRCTFNAIRRLRFQEHAWIDRCKIYATAATGTDFAAALESISSLDTLIVTFTGNLVVYNAVPAGFGIGLVWYVRDTGMEVYSIGNTYVNIYATNSFQALVHCTTTGTFYSRQDILYMPEGNYTITNKGVLHDTNGTLSIEYLYCVGVGAHVAGVTAFTLPAAFDATHASTGTCQAYTDAAASTLFVAAATTSTQAGTDYHLKVGAPATLLARNFLTPHMVASPLGEAYNGQFGCYPYGGDMAAGSSGLRPGASLVNRNRRPCP